MVPRLTGLLICAGIADFALLDKNKIANGSEIGVVGIGSIGHLLCLVNILEVR